MPPAIAVMFVGAVFMHSLGHWSVETPFYPYRVDDFMGVCCCAHTQPGQIQPHPLLDREDSTGTSFRAV